MLRTFDEIWHSDRMGLLMLPIKKHDCPTFGLDLLIHVEQLGIYGQLYRLKVYGEGLFGGKG